jgi:hypothetical protein
MTAIFVIAIYGLVLAFAGFWGIVWFRAIRKSRRLQAQYRNALPEERASLEERMETERGFAEYIVPLKWWEVVTPLIAIFGLLALKLAGHA